ncbi:hypothetical protein H257_12904 [Aphanomyces astaci]|nr:hypothetical protein H257_12904 [Aphanomyces astaci]ETV72139.1 hypothetical protein H257_12904 [Aphanomyces astaci]RHX98327.1 hypothetical protein DYB36_007220 [Aphanomyces astaci]RHY08053.1 hypothetical protein DYB25_006685 [Aphanomyces astaci]RHY43517.1 hypothetical protein DYB38_006235 [Aphanomyces astaci]RHY59926.1 hypothetical protein DYB30_004329 [Aphanomyces astaci]|eukprot:XP_009838582.1 hypothetical protein H257_12904 [Aphanomyces astaci]
MDNDGILAIVLGVLLGLPLLRFVILLIGNVIIVHHKEAVIVERWGRFHAKLGPGLHFLIPFLDNVKTITWRRLKIQMPHETDALVDKSFYRIDARQTIMDFKVQTIITRDNVEISVRPMVIYEFCDPMKVCYEVYDLSQAMKKLVHTTLRSIIGDMGLDDTLASREEINRGILLKIAHICFNWGIRIHRVELLEISPNRSVQEAMHQQLSAERVRRAAIVTAEGYREKVKTEAEGESQAKIALATGEQQCMIIRAKAAAEARLLIARAEGDALTLVKESLKDIAVDATQYMIAVRYMETLAAIANASKKCEVFMPLETDVVGALAGM